MCLGASTLLSIALDNLFSEREREREAACILSLSALPFLVAAHVIFEVRLRLLKKQFPDKKTSLNFEDPNQVSRQVLQ